MWMAYLPRRREEKEVILGTRDTNTPQMVTQAERKSSLSRWCLILCLNTAPVAREARQLPRASRLQMRLISSLPTPTLRARYGWLGPRILIARPWHMWADHAVGK